MWKGEEKKMVVSAVVILDYQITPIPDCCSFRMWSVAPVNQKKQSHAIPAGYLPEAPAVDNDEHELVDMFEDEEEDGAPIRDRDVRLEHRDGYYVEEFPKFNGRINLDTRDLDMVLRSIRGKPRQYPDFSMLDLLLFKKETVDHDPWVKFGCPREDPEMEKLAQRILDELLNSYQRKAVETALKHRMSFTLGPPGTGKTYTMALLILLIILRETGVVFVASPSNYATQNAYEAIMKMKELLGLDWINNHRMLSKSRERKDLLDNILNGGESKF